MGVYQYDSPSMDNVGKVYIHCPLRGMGEKPLTLVKDFSIGEVCNTIAKVPIRFTI